MPAQLAAKQVQNTASYRGLFAQPALRRLAIADICARLPQGMVSITLLLVAAHLAGQSPGAFSVHHDPFGPR
jgi:hypothetical protein